MSHTDVKGYYASINHYLPMDIVGRYVQDEYVLALLWGYLRRYVSDGVISFIAFDGGFIPRSVG